MLSWMPHDDSHMAALASFHGAIGIQEVVESRRERGLMGTRLNEGLETGLRLLRNAKLSDLSRWLSLSLALCIGWLTNSMLLGQLNPKVPIVDDQADTARLREMFNAQKADYQSDLIQHGLRFEPQLVRLENLILLATAIQDFAARREFADRARLHFEALFGIPSPQAWDAELAQKASSDLESFGAERKAWLAKAAQDYLEVDRLIADNRPEAALALVMSAIELRTKALDASHPDIGKSLLDAALLIESQGLGPLPISIRQRAWQLMVDDHPDYLFVLRGFSSLLYRQADHASAEQILRFTRLQLERLHFETSEMNASVLVELGTLSYMIGDYTTAKDRLLDALEVHRRLNQVATTDHATCLHTLALVLLEVGELHSAKKYFEESLRLDERLLGKTDPDFWMAKIRFAWLLYKAGEFNDAYQTANDALHQLELLGSTSISKRVVGLTVLGKSAQGLGEFDEAEARFREALRLVTIPTSEKSLDRHQGVLLNNLAKCLQARGAFVEASQLYRLAIIKTREEIDRQSATQSERQQIAFSSSLKYQLDNYLTCLLESDIAEDDAIVGEAYEQVFGWKGSVLVRQRQIQQFVKSGRAAEIFSELQRATIKLSKLSNSVPADQASLADWQKQVQLADEYKESLQRQLAQLAKNYIDSEQQSMSLERFQAMLPEEIVVIDYLVIRSPTPRLVAFVIRPHQSVRVIDLGPIEPIELAIEEWRSDIQARLPQSPAPFRLRAMLWKPFEAWIPDESTVLISTDGALGRMSFAALPGNARDRYLIEERRMAMLPVPQLLPSILNRPEAADQVQKLLTLGDADYEYTIDTNASTSSPPEKRAFTSRVLSTRHFGPLQETEREIVRIEEHFEGVFRPSEESMRRLSKANASEATFREAAPGYTHIHLATHGFFADPSLVATETIATSDTELPVIARSWRGVPAGLLSGLALSGANQPSRLNDLDDGILTADEISSLPLEHVELVVLSACETGLGKSAGGEGMLGLQRAFQISGARTTISSLWNVSDLGTRLLMDRFYENLWQRKLNKLDALREAQLYMLGKSQKDPSAMQLRAAVVDLPKAIVRPADPNQLSSPVTDFNHPFYWAAFNLAGDWR